MRTVQLAAMAVVLVGACVIPPQLTVEVNESEYRASCHCETCTDVDPATMTCRPGAIVTKDTDLFQCEDPTTVISQERTDQLEQRMRDLCGRQEVPGTSCSLNLIDFQGAHAHSDVLALASDEHNCPLTAPDGEPLPRIDPGATTQVISNARVTSSTIVLSSPDGSGTTHATGNVELIGGNCTTGTCPMRIVWTTLRGETFSFAGHDVAAPFFINTTIGEGTFFAASGVFVIPGGAMQITASGAVVGGRRGVLSTSAAPGFGLVNQRGRVLVFAQSFVAGDVAVDIELEAAIDNLMPTVRLPSDPQIECNAPGGASVALPAEIADADGRSHTSQWYVDGQLVASNVDTLRTFLGLGSHAVKLVVFDDSGGVAIASTDATVVDTTPPTIVADEICLWPPSHERFVIDRSAIHVADVCDPGASVSFVSGTSDQPDDGHGDGNTSDDIVIQPTAACVRSERDGRVLTGRTYTIVGSAQDASHNTAPFAFQVAVPHDRGPSSCTIFGGEPVDGGDPRCIPVTARDAGNSQVPPVSAATPHAAAPASGGCSASGTPGVAFALLVLGASLRRRR